MIIGQGGPLTQEEIDFLHNNRNSELVRIYRKQISHWYAQKAAFLIQAHPDKLQIAQGEMRGLAMAWNIPFQMSVVAGENEKNKNAEKKAQ